LIKISLIVGKKDTLISEYILINLLKFLMLTA